MSSVPVTATYRMLYAVGTALTIPIFIVDVANSTGSLTKPVSDLTGIKNTGKSLLVKDVLGPAIIKTGVYCTSFALFPKATIVAGFAYIILYSGLFDEYQFHSLSPVAGGTGGAGGAGGAGISSQPVSKIADKLR